MPQVRSYARVESAGAYQGGAIGRSCVRVRVRVREACMRVCEASRGAAENLSSGQKTR